MYGGQAGGGKSFFLRWWAVAYLIALFEYGVPQAQVGLFCEDYPSLRDRQISKIQMEFPSSLGKLREGAYGREFALSQKFGGGKILLRNLDDPSKYLSAEFAGIGVDELTRNDLSMFDFLRMRLRWPGVERPCFVGATNPGGIGHKWVKDLWIKSEFPKELQPLADEFKFVSARAADNPYLSQSYRDELGTLPPAMAKAYAEGSWDVFAGQYFDVFNIDRHVKPVGHLIKPWSSRWISIDWGFAHDSAVYWHSTVGSDKHVTYREFVKNNLTPKQLAAEIIKLSEGEKIQDVYLSPDAFARKMNQETVASQLTEEFREVGLPDPARADDDRIGGWMLMYGMLANDMWLIAPHCTRLIESMQALTRDPEPSRHEDALKADGDDPADSARYGLKSRLNLAPKPLSVRVNEKVEAVAASQGHTIETMEPTSRAMLIRRATRIERGKGIRPVRRPIFHPRHYQ